MLQFAKYTCLEREFTFSFGDMPFFRKQIKEEILMKQINSRIITQIDGDYHKKLFTEPFILLSFLNPPRKNLCFSNAVVSILLNIPILRKNLLSGEISNWDRESPLLRELQRLAKLPQFTKASTSKFRYMIKRKCIKSGQCDQNFSDNRQHDAGEFLLSVIRHLFEDSVAFTDFDEKLFGGLWQSILKCPCGDTTKKDIIQMPEVLPLEIYGGDIQQCLDHFFMPENLERTCPTCSSIICEKSVEIILEPSTIVVQLKRYEYDRDEDLIKKKNNRITCPTKLKMPSGSIFQLCSVINHIGSRPSEGHYNVLVYNNTEEKYLLLDDTTIEIDSEISVEKEKLNYLVTYVKSETNQ